MAELLPPPVPRPRTPGYVNPDIRRTVNDLVAMLSGGGPLADPQFRADVKARALDVPHGMARGISADLVGAPVDLVAQLMSLPRMAGLQSAPDFRQTPVGGSQWIGSQMEREGLLRPATGTGAETVGRVLGGAMASPRVVGPVMGTLEDAVRHGALGMTRPSPLTTWTGGNKVYPPTARNPLGEFDPNAGVTGSGGTLEGRGKYLSVDRPFAEQYSKPFPKGVLHKVDLPDELLPKMLDYSTPVSKQPQVLKSLSDNAQKLGLPENFRQMTGEQIYRHIIKSGWGETEAADLLSSVGIAGFKYKKPFEGRIVENFGVYPAYQERLTILERQ